MEAAKKELLIKANEMFEQAVKKTSDDRVKRLFENRRNKLKEKSEGHFIEVEGELFFHENFVKKLLTL